jgi:hypothetical protein
VPKPLCPLGPRRGWVGEITARVNRTHPPTAAAEPII